MGILVLHSHSCGRSAVVADGSQKELPLPPELLRKARGGALVSYRGAQPLSPPVFTIIVFLSFLLQ